MQTSSSAQYNPFSKILHWFMALLILGMLCMGYSMGLMEFSPLKMNLYMLHKSIGMTILGLVILRIIWRHVKSPPPHLDTHASWEVCLAHAIHILLYAGMIGMPLSGWVMSSAGEFPVDFFSLFEIPYITGKDEHLFEISRLTHEVFAYMIIAAIGLHFLGAAKHHIIDKDSTLRRMGGNFAVLAVGGILLLGATILAGNSLLPLLNAQTEQSADVAPDAATTSPSNEAAQATDTGAAPKSLATVSDEEKAFQWVINLEQSKIAFEFLQYGQGVQGSFKEFDGRIIFDPANPQNSDVDVVIKPASIETGSNDRNQQARSASWFDVEEFPVAIFKTESITLVEPNQYTARADLTIRGVTIPVVMPFSLEISDNGDGSESAVMRANISLMRLDFGVGQGEWQSTQAIDNEVKIDVEIHATHQKAP